MERATQYIAIEAEGSAEAIIKANRLLSQVACPWFDGYDIPDNTPPENLLESRLPELQHSRYRNFELITNEFDPNHVIAAIWAFGNDTPDQGKYGNLTEDARQKFNGQKQRVIDAINFIDGVWGPLSVFYDLEEGSTEAEGIMLRINSDPSMQFLVQVNFYYHAKV